MTTPNEVKFVLDRPQSDAPTYVLLLYRFNTDRLKYSTGCKILPANWNADTQRARVDQKTRKDRQPFVEVNTLLNRYESAVQTLANRLLMAGEPMTTDLLKQHLNQTFGKLAQADRKTRLNFFDYTEQFIADCETGKRLTERNRQYSPNTVKDYKKTVRVIERYRIQHPARLDFDDFTLTFYGRFKKYLTTTGYSLNTIGAMIKNLKILLKQAHRDGMHDNTAFKHEDFKKMQEEVDNIYLDNDELQRFHDLDLNKKPKLDRVRDLFLIGCYTGLRFSDFTELRPENITYNGRVLDVVTRKTGQRVKIPLNPKVAAIMAKYAGQLPRSISGQKFNDYLKEVAQLAGLTELVQLSRTEGGLKITRTLDKWSAVTSHTARRSFATNAYKAGVNTIDIMKLTGHKTETSFMRYIKITADDVAERLLDHPHFLGQTTTPTRRESVLKKVA